MRLRVHICNDDADADQLISFLKSDPDFRGTNIRKMSDPDIMVRDHRDDIANPRFVNRDSVSVVYEE